MKAATTGFAPGSTLGILGGGQLARMTAREAARLGYRVRVYSPQKFPCAGATCHRTHRGAWDDFEALTAFVDKVDVLTYELEGLPLETAQWLAECRPLRPGPELLAMAQDRRRERRWVEDHGLAGPAWAQVHDLDELDEALRTIGIPSVLKRAQGGYDGRGQCFIDPGTDARAAWASLGEVPCVLEERIDFVAELSVIAARDLGGRLAFYGPITNVHDHGILDHSVFPSHVPINVATEAREMARTIVEGLDVVGVVGIEMFLDTNGRLLINELAPRPHNSGHLTIETHATCQFEQHARAVLGLPLGSARALHPASTMVNLLGDLWSSGEPNWPVALSDDSTRVHLYGKKPKPRRKVGHMTVVAETSDLAREHALRLRQQLPAPATDNERKVKEVLAREAEVA